MHPFCRLPTLIEIWKLISMDICIWLYLFVKKILAEKMGDVVWSRGGRDPMFVWTKDTEIATEWYEEQCGWGTENVYVQSIQYTERESARERERDGEK